MSVIYTPLSRLSRASGVYQIRNIVNDKRYIGSSCNIHRRVKRHLYLLGKGSHHSQKLQRAWDKWGADSFVVEVIGIGSGSTLIELEQQAIDRYNAAGPTTGYNCQKRARTCTETSKAILRRQAQGRVRSPEAAKKQADALRGRPLDAARRAILADPVNQKKAAESRRGHVVTAETRRKMSESAKLRSRSK